MKNKIRNTKRPSLRTKLLRTNLTISATYFLLCGFLFVVAVSRLVGTYINHDLDFLLTEVSDNLNQHISYLENVVTSVRNSDELMKFLDSPSNPANLPYWKSEMIDTVDISSTSNRVTGSKPIVEKIYLFRPDGVYLSDSYYALLYSEVAGIDKQFIEIWQDYHILERKKNLFGGISYEKDGKLFMAYSILDNDMVNHGTIIFEINRKAIDEIMKDLHSYQDTMWILYNKDSIIAGDYPDPVHEQISSLRSKQTTDPYLGKISGRSYRIFTNRLCMKFNLTLAISQTQTFSILYDSVSFYIVGLIIILIMGIISFVIFSYKIAKPLQEITQKIQDVQRGNFESKLLVYNEQEFFEISQVFNEMTEYINHLVNQVYEKQLSVTKMKLRFIQAQMNPHFMFNVLNALALQAKLDDNNELSVVISNFSKLIQAKIYRSDSEKVSIAQELEYVEYYLQIQEFRYQDKLSYTIHVEDESILDYYIPKLCIQLIAENAVAHGLEPRMEQGSVKILLSYYEEGIQIVVKDDGIGFDRNGFIPLPLKMPAQDEKHNHVGINNVQNIIQLMYGKSYGIEIYSLQNRGTTVTIHVPKDSHN